MQQVFPDPEIRKYVWRWLSKCLSGENRDQDYNIWTGGGGNGKSVLVDLMNKLGRLCGYTTRTNHYKEAWCCRGS